MENRELTEINASLQAIVRRAYDLGRSEALKRVVDVLSEEHPADDQLALMAPSETAQPAGDVSMREHAVNGQEAASSKPWWAWPVR